MKRFAAQYIITSSGDILKRGVISCDNTGKIIDISDTQGDFKETASTPFYNGIIVPGFVNCHCHIELSDMKNQTSRGDGLGSFLKQVRDKRNPSRENALKAIKEADETIYSSGTSAVADICNTELSFAVKDISPVQYINLLEVFGINPEAAGKRLKEIGDLKIVADSYTSPSFIVPHSAYSLSKSLFIEVASLVRNNRLSSIHFLESEEERMLIEDMSGPMIDSYLAMGITKDMLNERAGNHLDVIEEYLPLSGNLLLVHNTVAQKEDIIRIQKRESTFWCLCPNSNLYIEDKLPPVEELRKQDARIVIGTDSLASNTSLNILDELITLQLKFPTLELEEIIIWATKNGAQALDMDNLGTIEMGKAPGLVLIENVDLENFRLRPDSVSKRLI